MATDLRLVQKVARQPGGRVKALVGSSRDPEVSYLVRYDGRAWACDCEAGSHGRQCWHVRAVRAWLADTMEGQVLSAYDFTPDVPDNPTRVHTLAEVEAAMADFDAFVAKLSA